jgi:glycosyltransferase involved in cell wall biosynthesis
MVTNMWPREQSPAYGVFVKRQVESLRSLGLRCDVMFVEGYRSRWDYARAAWYMLRLNWSPSRPSLVHGHGGEVALAVRWYLRGSVVVSYCGDDLLGTPRADGSLGRRLRRFVLRQHAHLMSATITKSAEMETALPPATRKRNLVLPNGVDRSMFHPQPRDDARRELGWKADERVVLFAADPAVPRKRFWLAQAACKEAARRVGEIRLEVANGVSAELMPRLMAAADCLLLTSSIEGSPNVVKEAAACQLPVVATDVGDVRKVLDGVEPSWVCVGHPNDLAAALVDCLTEPRRSNGWERTEWLDARQIATRLLELYGAIAPGTFRPNDQIEPPERRGVAAVEV